MCVQGVDVQCVLQFTLILAASCALHRRTSRVIHRIELSHDLYRYLTTAQHGRKACALAPEYSDPETCVQSVFLVRAAAACTNACVRAPVQATCAKNVSAEPRMPTPAAMPTLLPSDALASYCLRWDDGARHSRRLPPARGVPTGLGHWPALGARRRSRVGKRGGRSGKMAHLAIAISRHQTNPLNRYPPTHSVIIIVWPILTTSLVRGSAPSEQPVPHNRTARKTLQRRVALLPEGRNDVCAWLKRAHRTTLSGCDISRYPVEPYEHTRAALGRSQTRYS